MTDGAAPDQGQASDDKPGKSIAQKSIAGTRVLRWIAALVFAILAFRATGHDVCHATTTNLAGLPASSPLPRTQTTSTCTGVGFADLIGYFLVIAVLLLPDAQSIGVGGFRFERLTSKIDEVSKEVGALSQHLNQTFNFGANALDELRAGLRRQKADLDEVRDSLPDDQRTLSQLQVVDDIARRSDDASPPEIIRACMVAATLIDDAKRAAEEEFVRSTAVSEADLATAQDAGEVVTRILAAEDRGDQSAKAPGDEPDSGA